MTVHKVQGEDAAGYATYLAGAPVASRRGDYYLGTNGSCAEAPGHWHGQGAEVLGLHGEVNRPDLIAVWEGRDPRTWDIEVRRSATGEHVAAVDCTFSAPKSVSVVWATADPGLRNSIEQAQDRAVRTAVTHIEAATPLLRRRIEGEITHEPSAGLVAAVFRHHTSRLTAAQEAGDGIPDPQLHDHVAIANMALRRRDDPEQKPQWAAVDSRELYRIAAEAGAVYRAELAAGIQDLGFGVHREGRYFEIDGVGDAVRQSFSGRTQDIEKARREFIDTYGRIPTEAEARNLTLRTRTAKSATPADPFPTWAERAEGTGFDLGNVPRDGPEHRRRDAAVADVVDELTRPDGAHSLTASTAVFDTRQLRIAVAEAAQGRVPGGDVANLIDAVQADPELVRLDDRHLTTRTMREAEQEVIDRARTLAHRGAPPVREEAVDTAVGHARVALSNEQETAVRSLTGPQSIHLLSAPAGAGKGEVLRTVTESHQASGHRVVALAAAGETAHRLQQETGADSGWTIDGYIRGVTAGRITPAATDAVLVDEAALVETTRWRDLLRSTGPATLIAAGDAGQLPAIEAGGMWPVLEREVGTARLTENFRARQTWAADAWTALREGHATDSLRAFEERGNIAITANRADARQAATGLWDRHRQEAAASGRDPSAVLLLSDSSNREVDTLNQAAQQRRLEAGELGTESVEVTSPHRSGTGSRREHLHAGDNVVVQRRLVDADGRTTARNGATARVTGVDPTARSANIELSGGVRATVEGEQLNSLRLGYARHVYSAQGTTVDRAVLVTGGWQTGRESSYVGISRAREATDVVSDLSSLNLSEETRDQALPTLAARMAPSRSKSASVEFAPQIPDRQPTPTAEPDQTPEAASHSAQSRYQALVAATNSRTDRPQATESTAIDPRQQGRERGGTARGRER